MQISEKPEIIEVNGKTAEIFIFIEHFIKENGFSPTIREIGMGVNLKSTSSVSMHVKKLCDKGFIQRTTERPRTIRIIGEVHEAK